MRPVQKYNIGHVLSDGQTVKAEYNPYGNANPVLQENLGHYCSYCEVFNSDLDVEHIISKNQDSNLETSWNNFLISCRRCNGRDNKTNKPVDFSKLYMPHLNNSLLPFEYKEGGVISINQDLDANQKEKAQNTFNLLGLDKYPGNPSYRPTSKYPQGFPPGDKRWEHRRSAWDIAVSKRSDYKNKIISAEKIAEFATQRGFFSVWFAVFKAHTEVKQQLVSAFNGTAINCFNSDNEPIERNTTNIIDKI